MNRDKAASFWRAFLQPSNLSRRDVDLIFFESTDTRQRYFDQLYDAGQSSDLSDSGEFGEDFVAV